MRGRVSFQQLVAEMMWRSGKSFHECCVTLGRRGGKVAAARKRKIVAERRKQEAMKLV